MKSLANKLNAAAVAAAILFTSGAAFAAQSGPSGPGGPDKPVESTPRIENPDGGSKAPDVIRKEMAVSDYDLVKVSGKFKVFLKQGDEQKIVVEADEALISKVEHFQVDNTLSIYTSDDVKKRITLWITLKDTRNFNDFGNVRVIREK